MDIFGLGKCKTIEDKECVISNEGYKERICEKVIKVINTDVCEPGLQPISRVRQ
jgi:hypothetical protein